MKILKPTIATGFIILALAACNFMSSSPTATFKAFFEAQKKKDVPAMKKTLSKSSIQMIETAAKAQGKSVDDSFKEGLESPAGKSDKMPETRNEKIDGDNATLEVQDEDTKKWSKVYFVKEEKEWKIALDKTIQELFKNLGTP
jgi:flagellar hook-associated protein FlgK